jgi:uncharacterized membrane protein YphA (DoxX/SURF4 family)
MNTLLWTGQLFLVVVFVYSGLMKATQTESKLVAMGQTGVEGLPLPLIRFIALAELLGAIGLVVPWWSNCLPTLTPIAALCLGTIMLPAAWIHYRRREGWSVALNLFILVVCGLVAYGRFT